MYEKMSYKHVNINQTLLFKYFSKNIITLQTLTSHDTHMASPEISGKPLATLQILNLEKKSATYKTAKIK